MVRFRSLTAGLLVAGLLATGVAFAQGPRGGGPFGRGGRGPMGPGGAGLAIGALNLTDAQREQVREIRERYREQTQAAATQLAAALEKQRDAIEAIPLNESLITSLTQDLVRPQVEVALQQARINAEIWAVLTPEQQAQATKQKADREARMAGRRQDRAQQRNRQ